MTYKHCCVINPRGYYQTLVLVTSGSGTYDDYQVYSYKLKEGEELIDTKSPGGTLCKPRWDGARWGEGATAEEVAAWNAERAALLAEASAGTSLAEQVTDLQVAVTELYEEVIGDG